MFIATMEEEIVDLNVRLNQPVRQQNIIRHSFEFPEAWVMTSRLNHSFASLTRLVTGISEGKEIFCS